MPESAPMLAVALAGLAMTVALAVVMWVASLVAKDVSLVDRVWSLLIASAALVYFIRLPDHPDTLLRSFGIIAVVLAWALRLSFYITRRNWGRGEERRYQQIRARNQPNFEIKSLYLVFGLQAALAWIVSAPTLAGLAGPLPLGWLDIVGLLVAAVGLVFEAVADSQMARFRATTQSEGAVMDRGLWRYSRHPNYFGEACVWWGLWLMAIGAAGWAGAWSIVSPLLMTILLLKVSGVTLLEKDISERRPRYRDYVARTNAFIPGPPRRGPP